MSGEIDLSGETDPTDRMIERDERVLQRAHDDENFREAEEEGEMDTEEFDLDDALSNLQGDN